MTDPAAPSGLPPLTPRDAENALEEERQAVAAAARRFWPPGSVDLCPKCRERTFVGRDDMIVEVARPPVVYVFRGIRGAECTACGAQCVESADLALIEQKTADVSDYHVKVSALAGGRSLGTYWPADVVRNLGLSAGQVASVQVLSESAALIRVERASARAGDERAKGVAPVARRRSRRRSKTRR